MSLRALGPLRDPDPFVEACRRFDVRRGKVRPLSLDRVQKYLRTQLESWTILEWRSAAELLGHLVNELEERQRWDDQSRRILDAVLNAPRKPGRKAKFSSLGEAVLGRPKRARGRPPKLSEAENREYLQAFLKWKAHEERRRGTDLTDRAASHALLLERAKEQGERASRAKQKAVAFAKDISRLRQKYGMPRRRERRVTTKSQNSR
jgi:hypothetical protein